MSEIPRKKLAEDSRIAVVGGGGHAKEVIALLHALKFKHLVVFDDDEKRHGSEVLGVSITGDTQRLARVFPSEFDGAIIAIGNNSVRKQLAHALNLTWITLVHPTAWVADSTPLGAGSVIFAGAVVQPDCVVGEHAIINTSASISHDCFIEKYAHLAPGTRLTGGVTVREGALLGAGSILLPQTEVGEWATIGAGSVVTRSVPAATVAYGVPAKIHRSMST